MNKYFNKQTVLSFVLGGIMFSSVGVFPAATTFNVVPNPYNVVVNNKQANIEGYNIDGRTYLQTRDTAEILNADLDFKDNTIYINTDANTSNNIPEPTLKPTPVPTITPTQTSVDINNDESEVKKMSNQKTTPDGIEILYMFNENFEYDSQGKAYLDFMQLTNKCKSLNLKLIFNEDLSTYTIKDENDNIVVDNINTYQRGRIYISCDDYINIILPKITH